jgi:hypothetical protein
MHFGSGTKHYIGWEPFVGRWNYCDQMVLLINPRRWVALRRPHSITEGETTGLRPVDDPQGRRRPELPLLSSGTAYNSGWGGANCSSCSDAVMQ